MPAVGRNQVFFSQIHKYNPSGSDMNINALRCARDAAGCMRFRADGTIAVAVRQRHAVAFAVRGRVLRTP